MEIFLKKHMDSKSQVESKMGFQSFGDMNLDWH